MGGWCIAEISCCDTSRGETNRNGCKGARRFEIRTSFSFASFASSAVKRVWLIHARKQCSPSAQQIGTGAQPDRHNERAGACPPAQRRWPRYVRQRRKVTD